MTINANNLIKKYGNKTAVKNINIVLEPGKILGLLGPNGAGKSTTIKMLTGQIRPSSGKIIVDNIEYDHFPEELRTRIGIMPQEVVIWDDLTIFENLKMSASLYMLSAEKTEERIKFLVDSLKLQPEINTLAKNLSGGYKRRLNLAISIIHDPEVIFLDEPTPGIDVQSRLFLKNFIKGLATTKRYSIVLTDHYLEEAEDLCDYFVIIDRGELITEGTLKELKHKYGEGKFLEIDLGDSTNSKIQELLVKEFPDGKFLNQHFICLAENIVQTLDKSIKIIESEGIEVQNIAIKEPSLEDIFLLITGKDVRE